MKLCRLLIATLTIGQLRAEPLADSASVSGYYTGYLENVLNHSTLYNKSIAVSDAALIVVDMQNDFVGEFTYSNESIDAKNSPCSVALGGSNMACFGVREGNDTAVSIASLLRKHTFDVVIASMDDHSENHCSFSSSAGTTEIPPGCSEALSICNEDWTNCIGTNFLKEQNHSLTGLFPPHCVRGSEGALLYRSFFDAFLEYTHEKHIVQKGLDLTTDSFGVFPYSNETFQWYNESGLFDSTNGAPAALFRSSLTWEKRYKTGTGASEYMNVDKLRGSYVQPPQFTSLDGYKHNDTLLTRAPVAELVRNVSKVLVTGLALDWCVLDTALNAKAAFPSKDIYIILDSARPSFLPKQVAVNYLSGNVTLQAEQCISGEGCWLHAPSLIGKLLQKAGIRLIFSNQLV
uniref:Isochorismatase-like domain-containing protein n=1 Tax=Mucochytrium quahogii TaxID=96639 RepID=A0A7S2S014_9STRA|mmetsp:Transcript_38983/g.62903  ORF Transcript_38983/g.62903 Transcript_38983/m.62903 type:complete len:404 (-) Transcript_38983:10-1221(-)